MMNRIIYIIKYISICMCYGSMVAYFIKSFEITALETERLQNIYENLRANSLIINKISSVDVLSYPMSTFDIFSIRFSYGFDYDSAKLLLQYHKFHKVDVGSIDNLIEYENWVQPKQLYEVSSEDELDDVEYLRVTQLKRIVLILCFGYFMCYFSDYPPKLPKF